MLLNELFSITDFNADEETIIAKILLNPNHPVFKGHFPGNPILPGVCTVEIAKVLIEKATRQQLMLSKAGNIKYLGFINPLTTPEVSFSITKRTLEGGRITGSVAVSAAGVQTCTFKAEYSGISQ